MKMHANEEHDAILRTHRRPGLGRTAAAVVGAALFGFAGFGLGGCETTEGVGEDVSAAGEGIDRSAEDAQRDW